MNILEKYEVQETLRKQALHYQYLLEETPQEEITKLLKREAATYRPLCHGFKSISISPIMFHYALDQRLQEHDEMLKNLKTNYREILSKFDQASKAQPQLSGRIKDIKDIYVDGVRPAKKIIRDLWSDVYTKLHEPNQREEEIERIKKMKYQRETIAEDQQKQSVQPAATTTLTTEASKHPKSMNSKSTRKPGKKMRLKQADQNIYKMFKTGKEEDVKKLQNDKQQLLDDSVRFLGKQIDPYSTLHKRDANFYREVLLKDAGIEPESRDVNPRPNKQSIKMERMFQPKSARELFNDKNFKTQKLEKRIKVKRDYNELMKDIDLKEYIPDSTINSMRLDAFKVEPTKKKNHNISQQQSITLIRKMTQQSSQLNQSPKNLNNIFESFKQKLENDDSRNSSNSIHKFSRPQSAQESHKRHKSIQRYSSSVLKNQKQKQQQENLKWQQVLKFKNKQIDHFFKNINHGHHDQPFSTETIVKEAIETLDKKVKKAKKIKTLQMELNRMRTDQVAEVRRKDIINMKKKILKDPIEIGDIRESECGQKAIEQMDFDYHLTEIKLNASPNQSQEYVMTPDQIAKEIKNFNRNQQQNKDDMNKVQFEMGNEVQNQSQDDRGQNNDIHMLKVKSARLASAKAPTFKIQMKNIQNNNNAQTPGNKIRLISAKVSSAKHQSRVQTARTRMQSATTRPFTAYHSSNKMNQLRPFSPNTQKNTNNGGFMTARYSPTQTFQTMQQNAMLSTRDLRMSDGQPNNKTDSNYIKKLKLLRNECDVQIKDISKQKSKLNKIHQQETHHLAEMNENYEQKCQTVLELGQKKDAIEDFRFEKHTFIYGEQGQGRYLRKDGYDRIEVSERISRLNGKYAFMAENIKL